MLKQPAPPPLASPTDDPAAGAQAARARLLERLASDDRAQQRAACDDALVQLRAKDRGLRDALRELLRSGTRQTRFVAAWLLFRAETPSLRLLAALLDALELPDGDLRWEATLMLAQLGRLHGEVYPVLLSEARAHPSALRRRMAVYGLRELAPERPETQQTLVAAVSDASADVRRAAFASCPKLTELDASWLERAIAILERDPDAGMRVLAPLVLARVAELHRAARPRVTALLEELRGGADADLARSAALAARRLAVLQNQE